MVEGHAIDIPVTNLDDEDEVDDFSTHESDEDEELNANVFRDDFDLEQDAPLFDNGPSLSRKLRDAISKISGRRYNRLPRNMATNGIELQENFNDRDSFELSDEEFIHRGPKKSILSRTFGAVRRFFLHFVLLSFLIVIIVLAVLLAKRSKSKPTKNIKQVFSNGTSEFYPTTILISLDGFHPHYISSKLTPTLAEFLQKGYGPPYMIPSFPSSTFPNHWTMATGLYPQYHGIVGNTFYDPETKRKFINKVPKESLDPVFWGGEPIWSTAEHQGVRSAIHMYPGSEVKFEDGNPTEVDKFNSTEKLEKKSERIFGWLDRDLSTRPELIIGYVPTIDTLGHRNGIKGEELKKGLKYVDSFIKNITDGIKERNATEIINLVVVSDHGMAPTSNKRLIYLDDLVNSTKIQQIDGWPLFGLRPLPEFTAQEIYEELKASYKGKDSHYSIYLREELPREWNFGGPYRSRYYDRIAPVWVIPEVGYSITTHDDMERKKGDYSPKGVHGYNNTEVLMRAIFLGSGPYFKSRSQNDASFKVRPFQNTEVYNILCDTLNLSPSINNGSSSIFTQANVLAGDWKDDLSYPNVGFDIGGILKEESTYDQLFGGDKHKAANSIEATPQDKTEPSSAKPIETFASGEPKDHKTEKEKDKENTKTEQHKTKTDAEDEQKTKTVDGPEESGKHKGFFESIGEDLEELGEDIKEGFEDITEDIEDAFEDAYHKLKGEEEEGD